MMRPRHDWMTRPRHENALSCNQEGSKLYRECPKVFIDLFPRGCYSSGDRLIPNLLQVFLYDMNQGTFVSIGLFLGIVVRGCTLKINLVKHPLKS